MAMDRFASRVAALGLALLLPACGSQALTPKEAQQVINEIESTTSRVYLTLLDQGRSGAQGITATGKLPDLFSLHGTLTNEGENTGQVTVTTDETETDFRYSFDFDGWQNPSGLRITGGVLRQGHVTLTPSPGTIDETISGLVTLTDTIHAVGDLAVTIRQAEGCTLVVGSIAGVSISPQGCAKQPTPQP